MPAHLRAMLVVLVLSIFVFHFAKKPACALGCTAEDYERRRNLWIAITLGLFLSHNFWIFIAFTTITISLTLARETNKLALFFMLLFAAPAFRADIPGFGIVKSLFTIDYLRLLALVVLLPAFLELRKDPTTPKFGTFATDKIVSGYMILLLGLTFAASSFTHAIRSGVLYSFLDIFLPYYVASRSLKTLPSFRDALTAFVVAAMILSATGIFEYLRLWLLYAGLDDALGINSGMIYLKRGGDTLRAVATAGHAIPLGYAIAVSLGIFMYAKTLIKNPTMSVVALFLLLAGLMAPVSRGPWVGAAVTMLIFSMCSPKPMKSLMKLFAFGTVCAAVLLISPAADKFIDLLPFVGQGDEETVIYRQRLLEVAISVVLDNPFFGAYDYLYSPALQEMKQGQGIIDIVNSYLGIALANGLVGLTLFSSFFIASVFRIFSGMRSIADKNSELYLLGQSLLSTLLGILVTIFTVSSITIIPVIYWSVAGLGIAYASLVVRIKELDEQKESAATTATEKKVHLRPNTVSF